ncbi:MAG: DNA polymerase III subunit gamma/tau [Candidatus Taylorbacteria bacterium]|nr:DNA polymerase III subunit gamma/tau [Candidatus Taylorbacteria bacterium]
MSQTALYRKYRPQKFSEMVGQDHVVKVLENSIKFGNISHAYLFAGSRGTGKTSIARIFAKAVGCSDNDLYEIDAASNNGVDEMRLLNEGVNTLPFESKYKVYILDEAHMLSKSAFNALLKTLEEPPAHVIFILATTETEKLPETVVSRCQTFSFKKPTQKILKEVVLSRAVSEGFILDAPSAELIALLGDGSFRDTLGVLQKVLSSSPKKKITIEDIENVTGAPRGTFVNDFISAVNDGDKLSGLKAVAKAKENSVDMKVYLKLILQKLRFILILKNAKELESQIKEELTEEDFVFTKLIAGKADSRITSATLLEFLNVYDFIGKSYIEELPIELALIKITA